MYTCKLVKNEIDDDRHVRGGHPVLQVHSRSYTKNCDLPVSCLSSQPYPMGATVPARTAAMQFASFWGESRRVFHIAWPLRVHGREPRL